MGMVRLRFLLPPVLFFSTFAWVQQVSAHYTLGFQGVNGSAAPMGNPTNTMPDDHATNAYAQANGFAAGHLAYVSPGINYRPLLLQQNYYSPDGAIIIDTTGKRALGGESGYRSQSRTVVTTWGGEISGQDFYLEESGMPIPEFPVAGILASISAVAVAIILLRSKRERLEPGFALNRSQES